MSKAKKKTSRKTKKKGIVQIFNPCTKRWVKVDRTLGNVVAHKKTKGKYKNIRVYQKKK